jgi:tripartite-type tricarboxylate transporter receptor subunit TctC
MKRILIAAFAVALSSLAVSSGALAQDYPSRPVTLIIPWVAGGPTDIVMRAFADAASKRLGQPIVPENKAGGGGSVGPATMAAISKPDGYTISQMPDAVYRVQIMQKTTYDSQSDFTYIIALSGYAFGVTVPADSPFKKWQDVVDYAKANPGKVTYGSTGAAGSLHIGMERISAHSGIKLVHVPFKGSAEVNAATAGGHVMLGCSGSSAMPLAQAGKVRFLQIWTRNRISQLPDVPTLRECGYPFDIEGPIGLAGPKGMDPKVVQKIHNAFKKAIEDPAVIETMDRFEMVPNYKNSADYAASVKEQIQLEGELLKRIGLSKDSKK